jgi:hypothetical protein
LKQCFIESINRPWSPDIGPNTELTVSFVEARILGPELGVGLPDYDSQLPGNGTQAGGGNVAGFPSITSETASTTPGLAPF